jgi:hypothetical protein
LVNRMAIRTLRTKSLDDARNNGRRGHQAHTLGTPDPHFARSLGTPSPHFAQFDAL